MKISKLTAKSSTYPQLLRETVGFPKQLYTLGDLRSDLPLVAVVGSRKPTPYGREVTQQICTDLSQAGVGIISGLALGIDALAHRATLDAGGYTIAVLANGLDRIYPASNRGLAKNILQRHGAIVSEYEPGTPPLKFHFPARNRIVSGLALAVIITEAAASSGSLITANFALEQNREVMAVPGNITNPLSAGTNNLIKAGATPVTCGDDILTALGLERQAQTSTKIAASADEANIMQQLRAGLTDADEIIAILSWEPAKFNQTITLMELTGKVRKLGGGKWILG